ncbi:MAG: precorrin-6y C5,15-methyltransferase (decarboxylating) subunit CbiE [Bacteroidaceae bacterium]|nr:precorrin-6y C5,15-methyltransferase (decarboxylating) subunit CbiE [Bacteroidaceae bacterium]
MRFIVIGISDHPQPFFPPEVLEVIKNGSVFSGGKRHHEIVAPLLPEDAVWIDITAPLDAVFEQYKTHPQPLPIGRGVVTSSAGNTADKAIYSPPSQEGGGGGSLIVFASGDPLFFGFANTLKREFPEAEILVFPTFNSLQMLAHRLVMPYHDMRIVSLTGRPWPAFDRALIERAPKMGVLTDREHTPAAIARRMLDYGYTDYTMYVGEHLGNPTKETVSALTLEEAADRDFEMPNCLILDASQQPTTIPSQTRSQTPSPFPPRGESGMSLRDSNPFSSQKVPPLPPKGERGGGLGGSREGVWEQGRGRLSFGLPDSSFTLLDGREKMITKMPIRLLTLQALDLPRRHVLWDIGACTGSVSIEARLLFPHLHIEAFEIRPECEAIIRENARRHGAPGIHLRIGNFLESDPCSVDGGSSAVPPSRLDAVFIGGHGGHLKAIMAKAAHYLCPGGIIVMNSVTSAVVSRMTDRPSSRQLWDEACADLGLQQTPPLRIQLNDYNPIEILKAFKV